MQHKSEHARFDESRILWVHLNDIPVSDTSVDSARFAYSAMDVSMFAFKQYRYSVSGILPL